MKGSTGQVKIEKLKTVLNKEKISIFENFLWLLPLNNKEPVITEFPFLWPVVLKLSVPAIVADKDALKDVKAPEILNEINPFNKLPVVSWVNSPVEEL